MASKLPKGLGRGLSALIPNYVEEEPQETESESFANYSIDRIKPRENQPRKYFDQEKLQELASSIKQHGLLQPVLLAPDGDDYLLIAGERRYRAAVIAGLNEIPAVVREFDEKSMTQIALIENVQREDLNAMEEAMGYAQLRDDFSMGQEEIAEAVGKNRATIANSLRLLSLPEDVQEAVADKRLTAGHARAVLALDDANLRSEFSRYIISRELSVREAEKASKNFGEMKPEREQAKIDAQIVHLSEQLSSAFGTKVSVKGNGVTGKGRIEIEYYSNEDLERILERLAVEV